FFMYLVLAFGLSFLLPEALVALHFLGVLPLRTMLRGWRWAVVVGFTFAAMINPPPTPVFIVGPALAPGRLSLLAVGVAALREPTQRRRATRADAAATAPPTSHACGLPRTKVPPTVHGQVVRWPQMVMFHSGGDAMSQTTTAVPGTRPGPSR